MPSWTGDVLIEFFFPALIRFVSARSGSSIVQEGHPDLGRPQTSTMDAIREFQEIRARHLDLRFKANMARRSRRCRGWFVEADAWVRGGEGAEGAGVEASGRPSKPTVPADDTQTRCAVSGERFDIVFDDPSQDWVYVDAKRLFGSDAEERCVPEGAIVKCACV